LGTSLRKKKRKGCTREGKETSSWGGLCEATRGRKKSKRRRGGEKKGIRQGGKKGKKGEGGQQRRYSRRGKKEK